MKRMKNQCNKIEDLLLRFLYETLPNNLMKKVRQHLKICTECQMQFKKLKKDQDQFYNLPSSAKAPDRFDKIIKIGTQRKRVNENNKTFNLFQFLNYMRNLNIKMKMGIAAFILLFPLFLIFISPKKQYNMYILKASGDININRQAFFDDYHFRYNLNKSINIQLNTGKCLFQLNANKLISLSEHTAIRIDPQTNMYITLFHGKITGKMIKKDRKKKLVIVTKDGSFEIVGTIFSVTKSNAYTELQVAKGVVKSITTDGHHLIKKNERIRIKDNRVIFKKKNITSSKSFNEMKKENIVSNPEKSQKVIIMAHQKGSSVYSKKGLLGRTPFFILNSDNKLDKIFIASKNHITEEIDLKGNDRFIDISLKRKTKPEIVWAMRLKGSVYQRPIRVEDSLYIVDILGNTYKIDIKEKRTVWTFNPGSRISTSPFYYDQKIFAGYNDHYLYALDSEKGEMIWKSETGTLVDSVPQVYNGYLYVCNNKGSLYCLNIKNGKIKWHKAISKGFLGSPRIYKNYLYIGDLNGNVYSINLKKQKIEWTYRTHDKIIDCQPLIKNDLLIIGSSDKYLYALNRKTGKLKWKFFTGGKIFTSVVEIDGAILITTVNGLIYAVDPVKGNVKWFHDTEERILATPFYIEDKYIYIATDKKIYLINKWGVLIDHYKLKAIAFFVPEKNNMYLCSPENYLYNYNMFTSLD